VVWLFDINVLLAIGDSQHLFHDAIHDWLAAHKGHTWASCPLTENGFVRILSQPKYASGARQPAEAMELLRELRKARALKHVFWPDAVSLADSTLFHSERITRPGHITDVYLAALALRKEARLVTFDHGIPWQAVVGGTRGLIEVPRV
jgi:toxin-antitoxin system PIN domain toxin